MTRLFDIFLGPGQSRMACSIWIEERQAVAEETRQQWAALYTLQISVTRQKSSSKKGTAGALAVPVASPKWHKLKAAPTESSYLLSFNIFFL